MSFFVSDNLKGLITEEDVINDYDGDSSPYLEVECDADRKLFKIIKFSDDEKLCKFTLNTSENLSEVLHLNDQKISYSIKIDENRYLHNTGCFKVRCFKLNPDDNLVKSKIFIHKEV